MINTCQRCSQRLPLMANYCSRCGRQLAARDPIAVKRPKAPSSPLGPLGLALVILLPALMAVTWGLGGPRPSQPRIAQPPRTILVEPLRSHYRQLDVPPAVPTAPAKPPASSERHQSGSNQPGQRPHSGAGASD